MSKKRNPSIVEALSIIFILIVMIYLSVFKFGRSALVPIIIGIFIVTAISLFRLKVSWCDLESAIVSTISMALPSIIILMLVSITVAVWMASGIVPSIIYYGLDIISPTFFLPACTIICAITALGTGSSWTTVGTIGIALLGIGQGLGLSASVVGGAIISGSYFGDKLSPLSDTTNLASAMTGTNLFEHIKHMLYTTVPTFIISIILYLIIGFKSVNNSLNLNEIEVLQSGLINNFNSLSPLFLLVPIIVIVLVVRKVPAIPSLFIGVLLGSIIAMFVQGVSFPQFLDIVEYGYISQTNIEVVDSLLTRGGLNSMMPVIALTICALSLGGVLEKTGVLETILNSLLKLASNDFKLILTTMCTCFFINFTTGDQYLSIVLPGKMYTPAYNKVGLHSKNLSRALEDSATLTSPIIPWNACGIYMATTLGISVWSYLPFAFVNLINPILSLIYAYFNITITRCGASKVRSKLNSIT